MTFQFHCPCGRVLVGDPARLGQTLRCPACNRELLVPASAPGASLPPPRPPGCPGCASPLPPGATTCPACGRFVEAAAGLPSQRICPRCGAQISRGAPTCPACGSLLPAQDPTGAPAAEGARPGLAWEHRASLGWFRAGWETVRDILTRPSDSFRRMTPPENFSHAVSFYAAFQIAPSMILFGLLGGLGVLFWLPFSAFFAAHVPNFPTGLSHGVVVAIYLSGLVLLPVLNLIGLFLLAGLLHLTLLLCGGAKRSFPTTFSCLAYCYATLNLLQLPLFCITCIPYLGFCVSSILLLGFLAWLVMALVSAHETDTWRALLAVFGPFVLCGGCLLGILILNFAALQHGFR